MRVTSILASVVSWCEELMNWWREELKKQETPTQPQVMVMRKSGHHQPPRPLGTGIDRQHRKKTNNKTKILTCSDTTRKTGDTRDCTFIKIRLEDKSTRAYTLYISQTNKSFKKILSLLFNYYLL